MTLVPPCEVEGCMEPRLVASRREKREIIYFPRCKAHWAEKSKLAAARRARLVLAACLEENLWPRGRKRKTKEWVRRG